MTLMGFMYIILILYYKLGNNFASINSEKSGNKLILIISLQDIEITSCISKVIEIMICL